MSILEENFKNYIMKYLFVFLLIGLVSCGDDATGDAKNEHAKQPNCKDIDGFQTADISLIPNDYTGVAFKCVDGKVELLYNYKDGMPDGLVREWYENGQVSYEINWKEGKEDGLSRGWYENGHLRYELNFKDGEPISKKEWDENGKVSTPLALELLDFSAQPHPTYTGPYNLLVFDDYDKGLAYAKKIQTTVLLDFNGYACVNSRKMERNVWGAPGVIEILKNQLVVISLFVDDRTELPSDEQKMITDYRGRKVKLTTYGQKWSNLQASRYKTNYQPYYRMLSPDGEDLSNGSADYLNHNTPQKFKEWLKKGLE